MPMRYDKFFDVMKQKGITSYYLRKHKIIGEATIQSMREGRAIRMNVLCRLCYFLGCQPGDIMEYDLSEEDAPPEASMAAVDIARNAEEIKELSGAIEKGVMPALSADALISRASSAGAAAIEAYTGKKLTEYEEECLVSYYEVVMEEYLETERPSALDNPALMVEKAIQMQENDNLSDSFKEAMYKIFGEQYETEEISAAMNRAYEKWEKKHGYRKEMLAFLNGMYDKP